MVTLVSVVEDRVPNNVVERVNGGHEGEGESGVCQIRVV